MLLAFARLLSRLLDWLGSFGAKSVTGPIKDLSGAAKDVTGVRKDVVETHLAQHKLKELANRIQQATLEDVCRYDPKVGFVIERAKRQSPNHQSSLLVGLGIFIVLVVVYGHQVSIFRLILAFLLASIALAVVGIVFSIVAFGLVLIWDRMVDIWESRDRTPSD